MRLINNMAERVRNGIRSWLRIQPAQNSVINIKETLDFEGNAIKNRIWYRGESEELSQLYEQIDGDKTRFWAAVSTSGMEIRKLHVGIPALLSDTLASIVVADMNKIDVGSRQAEWNKIEEDHDFKELIKEAIT